jgi:hypothetical protein
MMREVNSRFTRADPTLKVGKARGSVAALKGDRFFDIYIQGSNTTF